MKQITYYHAFTIYIINKYTPKYINQGIGEAYRIILHLYNNFYLIQIVSLLINSYTSKKTGN